MLISAETDGCAVVLTRQPFPGPNGTARGEVTVKVDRISPGSMRSEIGFEFRILCKLPLNINLC